MTRTVTLRLLGCGLWLVLAGTASAQYNPYPTYNSGSRFAPYSRGPSTFPAGQPRLSPYLNMLRGGDPAANYYLGVVPEVERRRFEAQTRAGFQEVERELTTLPARGAVDLFPTLSQTGHAVQFMNPAPYFSTGPGSRPATGQAPQPFRPQKR